MNIHLSHGRIVVHMPGRKFPTLHEKHLYPQQDYAQGEYAYRNNDCPHVVINFDCKYMKRAVILSIYSN